MKIPPLIGMTLVFLGCTIRAPVDPIDARALERYQHLRSGTRVVVALNVGVRVNGVDTPSLMPALEETGTIERVNEDTLSLVVNHDGRPTTVNYAGRMIRDIRVLTEQPKRPAEPTPTAVTPPAAPESRRP